MYREKSDLSGRAAFITGGGRGIGLCTAEALLEHGARVVISDRDPAVLEAGRADLTEKGWEVDAVTLDVTVPRPSPAPRQRPTNGTAASTS